MANIFSSFITPFKQYITGEKRVSTASSPSVDNPYKKETFNQYVERKRAEERLQMSIDPEAVKAVQKIRKSAQQKQKPQEQPVQPAPAPQPEPQPSPQPEIAPQVEQPRQQQEAPSFDINEFQKKLFENIKRNVLPDGRGELSDIALLRSQIDKAQKELSAQRTLVENVGAQFQKFSQPKSVEDIANEVKRVRELVGIAPVEQKYNELYKQIVELPNEVRREFGIESTGITYPKSFVDEQIRKRLEVLKPQFDAVSEMLSQKQAMEKTIIDQYNLSQKEARQYLEDYFNTTKFSYDEANRRFSQIFSNYKDILNEQQKTVRENIQLGLKYPLANIAPDDDPMVAYVKAAPYAAQNEVLNLQRKAVQYAASQLDLQKTKLQISKLMGDSGISDSDVVNAIVNGIVYNGESMFTALENVGDTKTKKEVFKTLVARYNDVVDNSPKELFESRYVVKKLRGEDADPETVVKDVLEDTSLRMSLQTPEQLTKLYEAAQRWEDEMRQKEEGGKSLLGKLFTTSGRIRKYSPEEVDYRSLTTTLIAQP